MTSKKLFDNFFGFLKNRVKVTSPNQFGQKRKFLDNEETHLHTKFHEDLMNFNGSDKGRFNKNGQKFDLLPNPPTPSPPWKFGQSYEKFVDAFFSKSKP